MNVIRSLCESVAGCVWAGFEYRPVFYASYWCVGCRTAFCVRFPVLELVRPVLSLHGNRLDRRRGVHCADLNGFCGGIILIWLCDRLMMLCVIIQIQDQYRHSLHNIVTHLAYRSVCPSVNLHSISIYSFTYLSM